MSTNCFETSSHERVRTIADLQFGRGVGAALFPDEVGFTRSTTGRVRNIMLGNERLATVRAQDGRLTLGPAGARRLHAVLSPPSYRVVILDEVEEFVAAGKNAMARHVVQADGQIRAGDEVLIVASGDRFVATGTAILSGDEMTACMYGVAVNVRSGRE
ncbi:MAG TPA: pseudouridine synthase [Methanoregulaceae archaeon]|nr:pseudouridine synthase [Methanoregulaceae archaeon]HOV67199.1 pseudouridine synthase [Methanoregulaceae archaeon]HQJ87690.1 pseudouridine synthase [Methanoregulaceae archaeon]